MNIIETEDFKKDFKDLPISIRKLYQKQKTIFKQNWFDSRLHTKKLKNFQEYILSELHEGIEFFFYFRNDEAVFFKIGHRKDVYR
jgi:mRNA-degrading endonuclease RelE of RelBE toxin-antitoxin system